MNVEIAVNEYSLDRAEDSLANKLPNVNLHNSSISNVNVKHSRYWRRKISPRQEIYFPLKTRLL